MKFIAAALACFALIVGFCIANASYMTRQVGETDAALVACRDAANAGDSAGALARLIRLREEWESHHGYYATVVPHRTLDSVSLAFARCESQLATMSLPEFDAEVAALRRMLDLLLDAERLNPGNVF